MKDYLIEDAGLSGCFTNVVFAIRWIALKKRAVDGEALFPCLG